jgi:DNA-binding transcriptional MocR family regulator
VTRAYDLLREQDYLESRQGSGSVARLPMARAGRTDHLLMPRGSDESSIDLTIAAPAAPPGVLGAYQAALEHLPAYLSGSGYYPTGVPALREAIARRYDGRGLPTTPEQVVIVGGALSGLAIAAQALVRPGDRVLVETPTYPNPIMTLRARGARLVTTPVDAEHGWDVEGAMGTVRAQRPASSALSVTAEEQGVYLAAGPSFAPHGGLERQVRLPYTLPPDTLTEAVRRLAVAWQATPEERWTRPGRAPVVA